MHRHGRIGSLLDGGHRLEDRADAVGLGRSGEVQRRQRQVIETFGQPDPLEGFGAGRRDDDAVRLGQPDILPGQDQQAAHDETRVFPGHDHLRQPEQRRVRVGAAHRLDEGADRVVVLVEALIVMHRPLLDALLGDLQRDVHRAFPIGGRGQDGQFERVEGAAGVAVGDQDQVGQRVVVNLNLAEAEAALVVGHRPIQDQADVLVGQRVQLEDARATEQRPDDLEQRVLGGRADQDDQPILDVRQQRVLLGLVPAVNLVHEQHGALAIQVALLAGLLDHLAQLDAGALSVTGTSSFTTTAGNASITLNNASSYTGAVNLATNGTGDATLTGVTGAFDLGTVTVGGNLVVSSAGAITDSGVVTVTGTSSFATTAGNASITLNDANAFTGAVSLNPNGTGDATLTGVTTALDLGASTVGGNLVVSSAGAITDSGQVAVTGTSSFTTTAGNAPITLNNASSHTGTVSLATNGTGDGTLTGVTTALDL